MAEEKSKFSSENIGKALSKVAAGFSGGSSNPLADGISALGSSIGDAIKKKRKQGLMDKLAEQQTDSSALESNKYEDMA